MAVEPANPSDEQTWQIAEQSDGLLARIVPWPPGPCGIWPEATTQDCRIGASEPSDAFPPPA